MLSLLVAACGGDGDGDGSRAASSATPPSTTPVTTVPGPPEKICLNEPGDPEAYLFDGADGAKLAGAVTGKGKVGLVLAHQSGGDFCLWWPAARELAKKGYQVLAFDFVDGGGDSVAGPGGESTLAADVAAAAAEIRRKGASKVVLVGASMGGTAVLAGAPGVTPPVDAVVSLSAPASYQGTDAAGAVPKLRMPVLFAAAEDDGHFATDARALHKAAATKDKQLVIIPGRLHGVSLLETAGVLEVAERAKLRRTVDTFIKDATG